jgi:hypothetical protein
MRKYPTNKRVWLIASVMLFVIPWFGRDVNGTPHWGLFVIPFEFPNHASEALILIGMFSALIAGPAIAMGWVIQCVIVMIASAVRKQSN